ncbi:MAG TPA: DUF3592 domain-containing protein [Clostridia bacterium]
MKQPSIVFKIFFVIGSIFILTGSVLIINQILFLNKACSAEGTVIDMKMSKGKGHDKDTTFAPVVQFKLTEGENITFTSSVGSSPPQFKIGDSVKVLYNPDNPGNAEINSFLSLWFLQIIFLFIGMVFFIISIIGLSRMRRGKPLGVNYSFELSGKEMVYLLFKKKICPDCKGALIREKKKVDLGVGVSKWDGIHGSSYIYGQKYTVKYFFKCMECGKEFPLEKLAEPSPASHSIKPND